MTARAAEGPNMQAALDSAKSQPAINPRELPAQPIYRPNWTPGNNAPVLEGVVETADELRARLRSRQRRRLPHRSLEPLLLRRTVDWTPGGNPPAAGRCRLGLSIGRMGRAARPAQQPGVARAATSATEHLSITGPQKAIKADPRTMARPLPTAGMLAECLQKPQRLRRQGQCQSKWRRQGQ